jgi:hypothetical protein
MNETTTIKIDITNTYHDIIMSSADFAIECIDKGSYTYAIIELEHIKRLMDVYKDFTINEINFGENLMNIVHKKTES